MDRRDFLSLVSVPAFAGLVDQSGPSRPDSPEIFVWRQYSLKTGTQPPRVADYLQNAAIPALNRAGVSPVGVFEVTFGLPTPTSSCSRRSRRPRRCSASRPRSPGTSSLPPRDPPT